MSNTNGRVAGIFEVQAMHTIILNGDLQEYIDNGDFEDTNIIITEKPYNWRGFYNTTPPRCLWATVWDFETHTFELGHWEENKPFHDVNQAFYWDNVGIDSYTGKRFLKNQAYIYSIPKPH